MKKFMIMSGAVLFMTSLAFAGENSTQSEYKVKEKTTHSTTTQDGVDQPDARTNNSTTVEKHKRTTIDNGDGKTTTQEKVETKKEHSQTNN